MPSQIILDGKTFDKRLRMLSAHWRNSTRNSLDALSDLDAIVIIVGEPDDLAVYQKSTALHFWFFGYEFPETLLGIQPDRLIAISSAKKETLEKYSERHTELQFLKRAKDGSDQTQLFEEFFSLLEKQSSSGKLSKIGIFLKDKANGSFASDWKKFLDARGVILLDISSAIASLLAEKDEEEQELVRAAAKSSSSLLQEFVTDQILSIIDADKKSVSHSILSEKIEMVITALAEGKKSKFKIPSSLQPEHLEMCYPPIIQSGGNYSLKPSAISDDQPLHPGTIICSLGLRYKSYCSNVARTFLIDTTSQQERDYKFLVEIYNYLITLVRSGTMLSSIYNKGVEYIKDKRPDLEKFYLSSIGWSTGLEFREPDYILSAKGVKEICPGMTLVLMVGFANINLDPPKEDPRSNLYSLLISDTILVPSGSEREPQVLTECTKKLEDISYFFKSTSKKNKKEAHRDESESEVSAFEDEESDHSEDRDEDGTPSALSLSSHGRRMRTRSKTGHSKIDEESIRRREGHQISLLKRLLRDSLLKYTQLEESSTGMNQSVTDGKSLAPKVEFECYKKETHLPKEVKELKILTDRKNECIILPIFGIAVPFHISTIKNVTKSEEGEFTYLRINFNAPGSIGVTPGGGISGQPSHPSTSSSDFQYIRALSFRSSDTFHMLNIYKEINDLKKYLTTKQAEVRERSDIVVQEALIELPRSTSTSNQPHMRRSVRLPDLFMRPAWEGKRIPGDLDVHTNGIRYRSMLKPDAKVDILFSNMKHIFFQPCDNEMIVLIHIHLQHPIIIGKKKTKDVQFYREALEAIVDETGSRRRRHAYGDEDEIIQEQEERRRKAALNIEFKSFCEKLSESELNVQIPSVDVPIRELGFFGVPFRQTVFLMPTRDCLVHLTDPPFLIVSLSDVEVASLERVLFGLKHFDLIFIWKDHSKPPQHVDSIPISYLEPIRAWLDASDTYTMTSTINFNWTNVMKTIQDDPIGFYEMGGWEIIQARPEGGSRKANSDVSGSSDSSTDNDSVYDEEENEVEEESSEDDEYPDEPASDDESEFEESEDDSENEDEEEEEGLDWEELENQAKNADKAKVLANKQPPSGRTRK